MQLRFYLDGILVSEPYDADDMITSLTVSREISAVLVKQDVAVSFVGDGYELLDDAFKRDGFTGEMPVNVTYSVDEGANWRPYYKGILFLSDIEWDRKRLMAKVTIKDNSFYSRINNNKGLKLFPSSALSKNGVSITAPTIHNLVYWFDPANGSRILDNSGAYAKVYGYDVYDLLTFAVKYMSDDQMLFDSDYFSSGDFDNLFITTGRAFRKSTLTAFTATTDDFIEKWPGITFEELITDLSRLANLFFIIDYSTVKPTLRIEPQSYFENDTEILAELDNIDELKERTDVQQLYSKVKFGSAMNTTPEQAWASFPDELKMVGWSKEEYTVLGTSNIDRTLDLSMQKIITSSNMIEDIYDNRITGTDDELDEEIFLVSCITAADGYNTVYVPVETNWTAPSSSQVFYNELFTNENVANRYLGGVPNSIALTIQPVVSSNFFADRTTQSHDLGNTTSGTPVGVIFFNDSVGLGYDNGNNYDPINSEFTAPSPGPYTFNVRLSLRMYSDDPAACCLQPIFQSSISIEWLDSGFTPIASYVMALHNGTIWHGGQDNRVLDGTITLNLSAGEVVKIYTTVNAVQTGSGCSGTCSCTFDILDGHFTCTASPESGGIRQVYDPNDYSVLRSEFRYPISDSQRQAILNNPKGVIRFRRHGGGWRKGKIESLKIPINGDSQFTLSSTYKT